MSKIPEILTSISGEKIDTVEKWENFRREEIINLFEEYMYGVRDIERPDDLVFNVKRECYVYGMRVKDVEIGFDDYRFPFRLYLPAKQDKPVPAFIYVQHENLENYMHFDEDGNMRSAEKLSELPLKQLTDRGYACAVMPTFSLYVDWYAGANYNQGVLGAATKKTGRPRTKNSWASISAWAWGVSRIVDYFETDKDIDETKVAATGHSRSGKAALWAGATDKRILLTVPNNSGTCGAAVLRGKKGEKLVNINRKSDWLCPKFKEYNDCEELLPIDQHMLVATIAPRYIYITDSIEDEWCDPDAEFLSAKLASEVYSLYGLKGLIAPDAPVLSEVYQDGRIAFHVKPGDHSQTKFDWDNVIDYFDKVIEGKV